MSHELTVVIPVFNEGAGFAALWSALAGSIRSPFCALVVYDFDEDDTIPAARAIIERDEPRLRLVKNEIRKGVVGAILTGFRQAAQGPVLVVMADLSDDLSQVDRMLEVYRQGFHLVAGSRYMKEGRLEGGPPFKRVLSRVAGLSLHWLRGIPTHDATNAFKIYDSAMLKAFAIESCHGFELNLELTVKAFLAGYRIAEVPTVWRDRTSGQSHFRLWAWLPHYLKWYLYAFRRRQALAEV
jgi:glycosyltransferase involved in cell wall biosynthesis